MKSSTKLELVRRFFSRSALAAGCSAAVGIAGADLASAFTVANGNTEFLTFSYAIPTPLEMDGGSLIIDNFNNPPGPIVISATDSVLGRGQINFRTAQQGTPKFEFFGTTTVPGAPPDTFPADGMYLRAGSELSRADFVNRGSFVVGPGTIRLMGGAHFIAEVGSFLYLEADGDIEASILPGLAEPKLVVNGGSLIVRNSNTSATVSDVYAPIEHTAGTFEVQSGNLHLLLGGTYQNGVFRADSLGIDPLQTISFSGGTHVFRGQTQTSTGAFRIYPDAIVRATTTPPPSPSGGLWLHDSSTTMTVEGTLDIDGSTVYNTGQIVTTFDGRITGRTTPGGIGTFINDGSFIGEIRWSGSPIAYSDAVRVENSGTFVVDAGKTAEVGPFENSDELLVNGTLTTSPENRLDHFGGNLRGTGIINGDVFVGGGPGVASFRPGNSPGTMTINGAYTQDANGELELEIISNQPGQYDVVDASGGLTFNEGVIRFETPTFYVGAVGDQLDFFAGNPVSIGPNVVIIDNTDLQLAFDPGTGMATVPEPDAVALLASGLLGLVGIARRQRETAVSRGRRLEAGLS